jgi:D-sedoheptulose 7-phosphate isomerase
LKIIEINWHNYCQKIIYLLENVQTTDFLQNSLFIDDAISKLVNISLNIKSRGNQIFLCGNGASAAIASHTATDLEKNGKIKSRVFTDQSSITAIANDLGYENIFSEQISNHATKNDLLITISSSGNSKNIINAIEAAKLKQTKVITLSGFSPKNISRMSGDINFYASSDNYGLVETIHAAILHFYIDKIIMTEKI